MFEDAARFREAKPVFAAGKEKEYNANVIFRGSFAAEEGCAPVMYITASNIYKLYINGRFVSYGPARTTKNYYCVDELDLSGAVRPGRNEVAIYCTNSYVPCFHMLQVGGFVQAEIVAGGRVLFKTDRDSVTCADMDYRVQKTLRVNCQRTFIESYCLYPGYTETVKKPLAVAECGAVRLLKRGVPLADYTTAAACTAYKKFAFAQDGTFKDFFECGIAPNLPKELERFEEVERGFNISKQLQQVVRKEELHGDAFRLSGGEYSILDFSKVYSGFLGMRFRCRKEAHLAVVFDELLLDDEMRHARCVSQNFFEFTLQEGEYDFESMEVNAFRYIRPVCFSGEVEILSPYIRQFRSAHFADARFVSENAELNALFAAAADTYMQNAVDVFTDCPGRERGGWLCDSYFTGAAEKFLTGGNEVEREFLRNFARYAYDQKYLPYGMLPSVYPADSFGSKDAYIPNWAMFFVLELEEYYQRTGDSVTVERMKEKVYTLLSYFRAYENEDGLLEDLPGWVFIEWSRANELVGGLNYPTNMLYARVFAAVGRLYGDERCTARFAAMKETIIRQSWKNGYFYDQALRKDGRPVLTEGVSEACQYYAVHFLELREDARFADFIRKMISRFSGTDTADGVFGAAVFIGKYLRMRILSDMHLTPVILEECRNLFLPMMRRTGTLWENLNERGSCCHGFASYLAVLFYKNILGAEADTVRRIVHLHPVRCDIGRIEADLPAEEGAVHIRAEISSAGARYHITAPRGYRIGSVPDGVACSFETEN